MTPSDLYSTVSFIIISIGVWVFPKKNLNAFILKKFLKRKLRVFKILLRDRLFLINLLMSVLVKMSLF